MDEGDEFNYSWSMEPQPFIYRNDEFNKLNEQNFVRLSGMYSGTNSVMKPVREGFVHFEERDDLDYSEYLNFHENWNKLMTVVEEIEKLEDDHHGHFGVHISSNGCNIQGTMLWKAIERFSKYGSVYMSDPNAIFSTKKESTFYNVTEFIKWWIYDYDKERQDRLDSFDEPCELDYYEIRSGKCKYADVYNGNVNCSNPKCKEK
jgi:hypothetical protein